MSKISDIHALEILDSRGNPTLEVVVKTDEGFCGKAAVPSGASTGEHEAVELRDKDPKRYMGKGVLQAICNVNGPLRALLMGKSVFAQEEIDALMIEHDHTPNKSRMGANAILGISLATAKAAASAERLSLYQYLGRERKFFLPCPLINIINGGAHADNGLAFQEFMIVPKGAPSFREAIRWSAEIFHTLKELLKQAGHSTAVGDEGGFAPRLSAHEQALDYIAESIKKAGYTLKQDVSIALDCAASEFYDAAKKRYVDKQSGRMRTTKEQIDYLEELILNYPIDSIEDGLDQNDWEGWQELTARLSKHVQLVGDDIFVTNTVFLKKGIETHAATAILIKPNQIGTLSETLHAISLARKHDYTTILSHRSGETEDTTIADLAVATGCKQIKTGSLSRSERVAKYNRLLEIEDELTEQRSDQMRR